MNSECPYCERIITKYNCEICHACTNCGCMCRPCRTCKVNAVHPRHFCKKCNSCKKVCKCRGKAGFMKFEPKLTTHFNPLARLLGVEIECSEFGSLDRPTIESAKHFQGHFTRDGSVQPSGQELVLNPLGGDGFLRGMVELSKLLDTHECKVNDTCGFHAHVDGTDLGFFELRRLIRLYSNLEPALFELIVQRKRADNQFCVSFNQAWGGLADTLDQCRTTTDIKHTLIRTLYKVDLAPTVSDGLGHSNDPEAYGRYGSIAALGNRWQGTVNHKYPHNNNHRNVRYCALNLHSWFYRGSIEFRMFEGTVNLHDLVFWPLFCGWMVQVAANATDAGIRCVGLNEFLALVPVTVKTWATTRIRRTDLGDLF